MTFENYCDIRKTWRLHLLRGFFSGKGRNGSLWASQFCPQDSLCANFFSCSLTQQLIDDMGGTRAPFPKTHSFLFSVQMCYSWKHLPSHPHKSRSVTVHRQLQWEMSTWTVFLTFGQLCWTPASEGCWCSRDLCSLFVFPLCIPLSCLFLGEQGNRSAIHVPVESPVVQCLCISQPLALPSADHCTALFPF